MTIAPTPIIIDGSLSDWTLADRIDRPDAVPAGFALYGRTDGSDYVFALQASLAIRANTTLWLNTDQNANTGYQVFGLAGGEEYNVNTAADGTLSLYSGAAGQTLVAAGLIAAYSPDQTILEFRVPKAALGLPAGIDTLVDINDTTYLPGDYTAAPFTVLDSSVAVPDPSTQVGIAWTPADVIDRPDAVPPGFQVLARADGSDFVFALRAPTAISANTTLWLNTDRNAATGYQVFGFAGGAEYNVNIAADGSVNLYTGGAGQTLVASGLTAAYSADRTEIDFRIPKTSLGSPAGIDTLVDINDTTYLPGDYTAAPFTVLDSSVAVPDPSTQVGIAWTPADVIDRPDAVPPGYQVLARADGSDFVFALRAPMAIGTNTTLWLNTDRDATTGYQIFGFAGGAEYNVTIAPDGTLNLYTGGQAQTLIASRLTAAYSADRTEIDFRIPKALVGNPNAVDTLVDINNNTYLPGDFSAQPFTVFNDLGIARSPSTRIAIVYSVTTAANYFNETAYSQLFMSAQSAARAAGIPFDILTEADLTNITKLAQYNTIVFPSFRNVQLSQVNAISNTLEQVSKQYGVGLITSGDFMTNAADGGPLPGDSYARMKLIFDATRVTGGFPADVTINATDNAGLVLKNYAPGDVIHNYTGVGWNAYQSLNGAATTIATQTVGGQTYAAALAEQHGGRNVLFSTDGVMSDSNLLWQAIDYSAHAPGGPTVGLQLTRDTGIVAARVDMDQSQVLTDVKPTDGSPGIYDKLLPILADWKSTYNFVGSYYLNIGNNGGGELGTNWNVSLPYYAALLAGGNEIGTHSYTHPENTNVLTPDQIRFQFADSQTVLNSQISAYLGRPFQISGAAVPGAPETLATSEEILPYVGYLTGGYASVGSGFPNSFGYLTPALATKVYLAPNTSFDFTLVDFQNKTAVEAETAWAQEWSALTAKAQTPIVVWPFHDYGPTSFDVNGSGGSHYTTAMYTDWIARAAASGAEFVTLSDLASRISSFSGSDIATSVNGDTITVKVTSPDAGRFALKIDGAQGTLIQSVTNWYAYDAGHIFLPTSGGQFTIKLGATPDDVSHITTLPMRAALLSLSGDGRNLSFSLDGEGEVTLDIAAPGNDWSSVTGASIEAQVGDVLTLGLGAAGVHDVTLSYVADAPPVVTSDGGGDTAQISRVEGQIFVTTVTAADANIELGDRVTFSLAAGGDAGLFVIDAQSGTLSFLAAPSFDHPAGSGAPNVYQVAVLATDARGAVDLQTITVTISPAPPVPPTVVIGGVIQEGQLLTALVTAGETMSYQWSVSLNGGATYSDVAGATAATYLVREADEGGLIEAAVTSTNSHGLSAGATSLATTTVLDAAPTVNTPTISGLPQDGLTLSATSAAGQADNPITWQWRKSIDKGASYADIVGATGATYLVQATDDGALLDAVATAVNAQGVKASATSLPTAIITPPTVNLTAGSDTVTLSHVLINATATTLTSGDVIKLAGAGNILRLNGGGAFGLNKPKIFTVSPTLAGPGVLVVNATEGAGAALPTITLRKGLNTTISLATPLNPIAGSGAKVMGAVGDTSTIYLGDGTDTVTLGAITETVHGGSGKDTFNVTAATIGATIDGGTGASTLNVTGGGTVTMLAGITNIQTVTLAAGPNSIFTANGLNNLTVTGSTAAETIIGGAGTQILSGRGGADVLISGTGTNTFKDITANLALAIIQGFKSGDTIDLTNFKWSSTIATTVTWSVNVLTVKQGAKTVQLNLRGQGSGYTGIFSSAGDHAAGMAITYKPPPAAALASAPLSFQVAGMAQAMASLLAGPAPSWTPRELPPHQLAFMTLVAQP